MSGDEAPSNLALRSRPSLSSQLVEEFRSYPLPAGASWEVPTMDATPSNPPDGCVAVSIGSLRAGFRLYHHSFILHILNSYNISPAQLHPNGWRHLLSFSRWLHDLHLLPIFNFGMWCAIFSLTRTPNTVGYFYFMVKPSFRSLFSIVQDGDDGWKFHWIWARNSALGWDFRCTWAEHPKAPLGGLTPREMEWLDIVKCSLTSIGSLTVDRLGSDLDCRKADYPCGFPTLEVPQDTPLPTLASLFPELVGKVGPAVRSPGGRKKKKKTRTTRGRPERTPLPTPVPRASVPPTWLQESTFPRRPKTVVNRGIRIGPVGRPVAEPRAPPAESGAPVEPEEEEATLATSSSTSSHDTVEEVLSSGESEPEGVVPPEEAAVAEPASPAAATVCSPEREMEPASLATATVRSPELAMVLYSPPLEGEHSAEELGQVPSEGALDGQALGEVPSTALPSPSPAGAVASSPTGAPSSSAEGASHLSSVVAGMRIDPAVLRAALKRGHSPGPSSSPERPLQRRRMQTPPLSASTRPAASSAEPSSAPASIPAPSPPAASARVRPPSSATSSAAAGPSASAGPSTSGPRQLPPDVVAAILGGDTDPPASFLDRPDVALRFLYRLVRRDDRERASETTADQFELEGCCDIIRGIVRLRTMAERNRTLERVMPHFDQLRGNLVFLREELARAEQRVRSISEFQAERDLALAQAESLREELEREKRRREDAEGESREVRGRLSEAALQVETAEAERRSLEVAWGEAEAALKASEVARESTRKELEVLREAMITSLKAKESEIASLLSDRSSREEEHARELERARLERLEELARGPAGVELAVSYFTDGFNSCKRAVSRKLPDVPLDDIRPGDDEDF